MLHFSGLARPSRSAHLMFRGREVHILPHKMTIKIMGTPPLKAATVVAVCPSPTGGLKKCHPPFLISAVGYYIRVQCPSPSAAPNAPSLCTL